MKTNKQAFTLIELLIIVLIIGILAAVALPQYQLAINKTKFSKLRSLAATYVRAAKLYYDMNGTYSKDISEIGIDFPAEMTISTTQFSTCAYNSEFYCCIGETHANYIAASITCGQRDYSFAVRNTLSGNQQICIANKENTNAIKLCKSLGTTSHSREETMWPYPEGYMSGYAFYLNN